MARPFAVASPAPRWEPMRWFLERARAAIAGRHQARGDGFIAYKDQAETTLRDFAAHVGLDLADPRVVHAVGAGFYLCVHIARRMPAASHDVYDLLLSAWASIEHLAPGGHEEVR